MANWKLQLILTALMANGIKTKNDYDKITVCDVAFKFDDLEAICAKYQWKANTLNINAYNAVIEFVLQKVTEAHVIKEAVK